MTKLHAKNGSLYLGDEHLLCVYDAGDCDHISWPNPNLKNLFCALFDLGNMDEGTPYYGPIYLPDGVLFGELVPCGFNLEKALA